MYGVAQLKVIKEPRENQSYTLHLVRMFQRSVRTAVSLSVCQSVCKSVLSRTYNLKLESKIYILPCN